MENFISTIMWKHLKTSPTHIRLHTRKTCVFWMKSTADRSFSLLSSGKVDTSLCNCENVFCTCRFFCSILLRGILFILTEIMRMFSSLIEKLFSTSGTTLSFIFCNVRSSHRERGTLGVLSRPCNILAQALPIKNPSTI